MRSDSSDLSESDGVDKWDHAVRGGALLHVASCSIYSSEAPCLSYRRDDGRVIVGQNLVFSSV